MNTAPIKIAFFLVLLTSCAHKKLTKSQIENAYANHFVNETACTEGYYKATQVNVNKNLFGNVMSRNFLFECGKEKYACKTWWYNYREHSKCTPKRVYSSK
jgi:hypothetical protein